LNGSSGASEYKPSITLGTGGKRTMNIDESDVRSEENGGYQTLRQVPTTSPTYVPRYMQPKNVTSRSSLGGTK
jgi:hypothetical protein